MIITTTTIPEPHAVHEDGRVLASRVMLLDHDGMLRSPIQETPWTQRTMRAHRWDDSALVDGAAGLHAIAYQPEAQPYQSRVVAHVACEGRCAFSPLGSHGLRAERMEIIRLVVHADDAGLADALRLRYGVPVRVAPPVRSRRRHVLLDDEGVLVIMSFLGGALVRRVEQWPDGTVRVSHWHDGLLHGWSEVRYPAGTAIALLYCDGRLVERPVEAAR